MVRGPIQRIEGIAWEGAFVEIEVNGRLVATEVARHGGRFVVEVPLERGANQVLVEAYDSDGTRSLRSRLHGIRRTDSAARSGLLVRI